jgi:hypothetical protein
MIIKNIALHISSILLEPYRIVYNFRNGASSLWGAVKTPRTNMPFVVKNEVKYCLLFGDAYLLVGTGNSDELWINVDCVTEHASVLTGVLWRKSSMWLSILLDCGVRTFAIMTIASQRKPPRAAPTPLVGSSGKSPPPPGSSQGPEHCNPARPSQNHLPSRHT